MHSTPTQFETDTQNFYLKYRGKFIDQDGAFGNQCTDLVKLYCTKVLKIPAPHGNAIDYLQGIQGFTLIKPDGTNKPAFGDIVVFNYPPVGHVALTNWTSAGFVNCFSQNDPLQSPCDFKTYDYSHIAGWLHWNGTQKLSTPIQVARIGENIPSSQDFINEVAKYGINITCIDYNVHINVQDSLNQESAYNVLDFVNPTETFVEMFYQSTQAVPYATSYSSPKGKYVSTLPNADVKTQAFELSHCLQLYCNDKFNAHLQIDDVALHSYADFVLTQKKFDSIKRYL